MVVTKFFPVGDLELLAGLGVGDVGESRDQEAAAKLRRRWPGAPAAPCTCTSSGRCRAARPASVARYADTVHSVDRPKLVAALDRGAEAAGRRLQALVQVNLGRRPPAAAGCGRGTCAGWPTTWRRRTHLDLRGVMAVAPLGADPAQAFARLQEVAAGVRADHPEAGWISAGMSGDLEDAVANGATHLRVGTRNPRITSAASVVSGGRPVCHAPTTRTTTQDQGARMAGALRKTMVYLGLAEDDERYDAYDDYDDDYDEQPARREQPQAAPARSAPPRSRRCRSARRSPAWSATSRSAA